MYSWERAQPETSHRIIEQPATIWEQQVIPLAGTQSRAELVRHGGWGGRVMHHAGIQLYPTNIGGHPRV